MTLSNRRYDHLDHEFLFYDEHDADTIPVCMVATETPALRAVTVEGLKLPGLSNTQTREKGE